MRYCRAMTTPVHPEGFPALLVDDALRTACASRASPPVFAITGLQGSGKSTLAEQVAARARGEGLRVAVLSLDDLYLTRAQRQRLAAEGHPLLATRGPPGTHDVALGCRVLDALRHGEGVMLPRFDKLADDRAPDDAWTRIDGRVDLVLFEGWCLKAMPEDDAALATPINALERDEDADGRWRRHCNDALRNDYPALWSRIDALWFLQPPGFKIVRTWRWEQEQALVARDPQRTGMDRAQLDRFIQHYERTSRHLLATLPAIAERTIALDESRHPIPVQGPVGAT
ncbi:kinase [uncultured Pseudoxanthomonas sp.]|uniref:kinase n=1 Tax=uncultured Pseudoxanthomonas sp. TaxID=281701 RepID=UPI00262A3F97|nr:kinase [uncultured Pseudoxanthomonas sp.]